MKITKKHCSSAVRLFMLIGFAVLPYIPLAAQIVLWDKSFGETDYETNAINTSIVATNDGGFLLGGSKTPGPMPENYYHWVIKIDANGNKIWDKSFRGTKNNFLRSMVATNDGGFLLGGSSNSGIGGDKTQDSRGDYDCWVIKIDANGNKIWDKCFGGTGNDGLHSMVATNDGGFLLGGYSNSGIGGDKTQDSRGDYDCWVIKIDANGNKIWDKRFGGTGSDGLRSIVATNNGGFLLGGSSNSGIGGDKTQDLRGEDDYWVVKIDANGNKIWDKRFGGTGSDVLSSMVATNDGGFLLGGTSYSGIGGDKTQDSRGYYDYWVVKTDANGNKIWDKRFGGTERDDLRSMVATNDGGFLLGGTSNSGIGGDKTQDSRRSGESDYWVVKIDANRNKVWDKRFGGKDSELLTSMVTTNNGGFLLGGVSSSGIGGDKTQDSRGYINYWVVYVQEYNLVRIPNNDIHCKPFCPELLLPVKGCWSEIASLSFRVNLPAGKASFQSEKFEYNKALSSPVTYKVENDNTLFISWNNSQNISLPEESWLVNLSYKILDNSSDFTISLSDVKAYNAKGEPVSLATFDGLVSIINSPKRQANPETKEKRETESGIFSIYPNPGTDVFQLVLPHSGVYQIEITNAQGKVLSQFSNRKYTKDTPENIDLQGLPPGILLIHISDGKNTYRSKIIKY